MSTRDILQRYVTIKLNYIADQAGMTTDQVSKALAKKRKLDADEFIRICKVLNIPLKYFMDDDQAAAQDVG